MERKITIGGKEYLMKSSAYTQFKYKDETGRSLLKDLTQLGSKFSNVKEENILDNYDELNDFIITTLRIAYIMSMEAKSFTGRFEDYLMEIDNYLDNADWISEVIELAISPLSGNLQAIKK